MTLCFMCITEFDFCIHYWSVYIYAAKSLQSCPTQCDPIDCSPTGSSVPGFLQARTRVGCHFLLQYVKVKSLSRVRLFETPWTVSYQAPPSMGFSRQQYWSGVPLPSPVYIDQIRSVAQSCPTLCDPMNSSTPGLPVHHQLPEFTET